MSASPHGPNQRGQVLHVNPMTGATTFWLENEDGDWATWTELPDVQDVMDFAHEKGCEAPTSLALRHIGEIPTPFIDQAIREGWYHDPRAWRRFLDENSRFKVHKW